MKKIIFLPLSFILFTSMIVFGQNPVPDPDTLENPVQEGDPAVRNLPPRMDYVEDMKRITAEEIPDAVRQTLEGSAQYSDWQKAMIFHDENKDEYVIEFKDAGKVTSYRFNKDGRPIVEE